MSEFRRWVRVDPIYAAFLAGFALGVFSMWPIR